MWFTIDDIDKFVESTRVLVYNIFGDKDASVENVDFNIKNLSEESLQEINRCLSQDESKTILLDFVKAVPGKRGFYKISTNKYMEFMESLNTRLVSNILGKLTNDGLLESAFDEEVNDFVFWAKENEHKDGTKD